MKAIFETLENDVVIGTFEKSFDSTNDIYKWWTSQSGHPWLTISLKSIDDRDNNE